MPFKYTEQKIKFDYFTLRCKTSCKAGGQAVWQTVAVVSALALRPRGPSNNFHKWSEVSRLKNGPSHLCRVEPEQMHEYWIASPILESKMADIGDKQYVLVVRM